MIIQHEKISIKKMDLENAGLVSSHIKKVLNFMMIPKPIIKRIAIATYEAEINVVIHSNGGHCVYSIHNDRIHVIFRDCGPGIADIPQAMIEGYSTADGEAINHGFGAGMGLANIKQASDEFSLISTPEGTILEITIYFNGDAYENK